MALAQAAPKPEARGRMQGHRMISAVLPTRKNTRCEVQISPWKSCAVQADKKPQNPRKCQERRLGHRQHTHTPHTLMQLFAFDERNPDARSCDTWSVAVTADSLRSVAVTADSLRSPGMRNSAKDPPCLMLNNGASLAAIFGKPVVV